MPIVLIVEIKNQLISSRQCIRVYHHHTGIADIICFNQSISLSLRELTGSRQRDYLQISVEKETECCHCFYLINLPSWVHFQLNLTGRSGISANYSRDRQLLKLSLSYDCWQIRIFRPTESDCSTIDSVTIKDSPGQSPLLIKNKPHMGRSNDGNSREKKRRHDHGCKND